MDICHSPVKIPFFMCTLNSKVYVKTFALESLSKKLVLSGSGVVIERLKDEFRFQKNCLIPGKFPKNYEEVTEKKS